MLGSAISSGTTAIAEPYTNRSTNRAAAAPIRVSSSVLRLAPPPDPVDWSASFPVTVRLAPAGRECRSAGSIAC